MYLQPANEGQYLKSRFEGLSMRTSLWKYALNSLALYILQDAQPLPSPKGETRATTLLRLPCK
jgi:hypothetical protein